METHFPILIATELFFYFVFDLVTVIKSTQDSSTHLGQHAKKIGSGISKTDEEAKGRKKTTCQ